MMKYRKTFLLLIFLIASIPIQAQSPKDSELFLTLKKLDSTFFERGFNQCDSVFLKKSIHKDLQFYHDKGGFQNRNDFLESVRKNLCANMDSKPIRKVDVNSLEVFPMYNNNVLYGAIQSGTHYFYIREKGKKDLLAGKAKFTHLYLLENGKWLLKEVLSFDHQDAKE